MLYVHEAYDALFVEVMAALEDYERLEKRNLLLLHGYYLTPRLVLVGLLVAG